jgi:cytoskeleton protein RodZ
MLPPDSAGTLLRRAREAEGLHIAALAVALKVPVKKIEALEADRLHELPDIVFVRALAASVCRALKIAPAPILERLPQSSQPQLKTVETGTKASFRAKGLRSEAWLWHALSRPYFLAILLLVLGLAALIFLPIKLSPTTPAGSVPAVVELVAPLPVAAEVTMPASSSTAALPPVAQGGPTIGVAANTTVTGSGSTTGVLVLQASGASWVEVTDAKGVVQLRKTMAQGELQGVSGVLPMAVVLGRAGVMTVQIRGVPFDVGAVTKDNVARFEVK